MKKNLFILLLLPLLAFWQPTAYANDAELERALEAYKEENYQKAYEIFLSLAEQGIPKAQIYLASMYQTGVGVTQNDEEGAKWIRVAAEQGDLEGQYFLGTLYRDGEGVPQDKREMLKWFRLSAEGGFAEAQSSLAAMYITGEQIPQNDKKALKWLRLAAAQGDSAAQGNLGIMHLTGSGVPQNSIQAYMWFLIAKLGGSDVAVFEDVKKSLNYSQIKEAKALSTRCIESDYRDCGE